MLVPAALEQADRRAARLDVQVAGGDRDRSASGPACRHARSRPAAASARWPGCRRRAGRSRRAPRRCPGRRPASWSRSARAASGRRPGRSRPSVASASPPTARRHRVVRGRDRAAAGGRPGGLTFGFGQGTGAALGTGPAPGRTAPGRRRPDRAAGRRRRARPGPAAAASGRHDAPPDRGGGGATHHGQVTPASRRRRSNCASGTVSPSPPPAPTISRGMLGGHVGAGEAGPQRRRHGQDVVLAVLADGDRTVRLQIPAAQLRPVRGAAVERPGAQHGWGRDRARRPAGRSRRAARPASRASAARPASSAAAWPATACRRCSCQAARSSSMATTLTCIRAWPLPPGFSRSPSRSARRTPIRANTSCN